MRRAKWVPWAGTEGTERGLRESHGVEPGVDELPMRTVRWKEGVANDVGAILPDTRERAFLAGCHVDRKAGAPRPDSAGLPAAKGRAQEARGMAQRGQIVDRPEREVVRGIEVGAAVVEPRIERVGIGDGQLGFDGFIVEALGKCIVGDERETLRLKSCAIPPASTPKLSSF